MISPHPRHLRRTIERALRPAQRELSPLSIAVRRLALQIQRQTARRLPTQELVEQIVSWIAERRSSPGVAAGQWPTTVLQETRELALPSGV
jgi:hypothetical protein